MIYTYICVGDNLRCFIHNHKDKSIATINKGQTCKGKGENAAAGTMFSDGEAGKDPDWNKSL